MPPLRPQNLKKLVRKLSANSQPSEQLQALNVIRQGCCERKDFHFQDAIVAVGVIPLLVPLLGPGAPADVQELAARILAELAQAADANKVTIAAVGAIPLLVQRMGPSSPVVVQVYATSALSSLATNVENAAHIVSAGAIPRLVQFLDPGDGPPAVMQGIAASTLGLLAVRSGDYAATIASAGAIPLLVQLLKPGSPAGMRYSAALVLAKIASNAENAVTTASAGAIPPLAELLRSGADETKGVAAAALEAIRNGISENRAVAAAAKASEDMAQAMEGLGVESPSDAQLAG
jgi:hypothetical protein